MTGGPDTATATLANLLLPPGAPATPVRVSLLSYGLRLALATATLVPGSRPAAAGPVTLAPIRPIRVTVLVRQQVPGGTPSPGNLTVCAPAQLTHTGQPCHAALVP